jgi:hypothetical protein
MNTTIIHETIAQLPDEVQAFVTRRGERMTTTRTLIGMVCFCLVLGLGMQASGGTRQPAPQAPPTPKTPVERFMVKARELDPQSRLIVSAKTGKDPSELWVAMTQLFHSAHYQERLQLTQAIGGAWRTISGDSGSTVFITDRIDNIVGSVSRSGYARVQER